MIKCIPQSISLVREQAVTPFGEGRLFQAPAALAQPTEYLTPDSLADFLGVSRRTIDRWHALRFGPPKIRVGRLVRYRRSAVERWLEQNEIVPLRGANDNLPDEGGKR